MCCGPSLCCDVTKVLTTDKPEMRSLDSTYLGDKHFLKNFTLVELQSHLNAKGIPAFRATQIFQSVYARRASALAELLQLPAVLREEIDRYFVFSSLELERQQVSSDGTIKYLFRLKDGAHIEAVLIPSELLESDGSPKRRTLCISTQAGCPLGCAFCATATLHLQRNLECAEIVDQLLEAQQLSGTDITNIVFMGMGEPMLNYDNVMKAVDIITHPEAKLVPAKRITLSTAGVVPGIMRMADEKRSIKLALSLHATTNGLRQKLMPIAQKYSLEELGNALEYYYRATKIPVTFEYIVFEGLNDSDLDVKRLARLTRRVPTKVNVIPFHTIEFTHPTGMAAELRPCSPERFKSFIQALKDNDVQVMVRSSSGLDIDAACGQLALSEEHQPSATAETADTADTPGSSVKEA